MPTWVLWGSSSIRAPRRWDVRPTLYRRSTQNIEPMPGLFANDYRSWNELLAERFFGGLAAYRPVYLDVDDAVVASLRPDLSDPTGDFTNAVRRTVLVNDAISLDRHLTERNRWKADPSDREPPFVALLSLFVVAANRMRASENYASTNYYKPLAALLSDSPGEFERVHRRLPFLGADMSALWDELNAWLGRVGGRRGIPTAYSFGGNTHVSRPISQALIRDSDHPTLLRLFAITGLEPSAPPAPRRMRQYLEEWALAGLLSSALKMLLREEAAADAITQAALDLLMDWDGESAAQEHSSASSESRSRWRLLLKHRPRPARRPLLEATFVAKDAGGRREGVVHANLEDRQVSATARRTALQGWIQLDLSLPVSEIPPRCRFKVSSGNEPWDAGEVVLLREDREELFGFVETADPVEGTRHIVLRRRGMKDGDADLGLDLLTPEFMGDWEVFQGVWPAEDARGPQLRLVGGVKMPGSATFHADAPPRLSVQGATAGERLVLERGTGHGISRTEWELNAEAETFSIPKAGRQGRYFARLVGVRSTVDGERLQALARTRLSLVAAADLPPADREWPGYDLSTPVVPGLMNGLAPLPTTAFLRGGEAGTPDSELDPEVGPCAPGQRRSWQIVPPCPQADLRSRLATCPDCDSPITVKALSVHEGLVDVVAGECLPPHETPEVRPWRRTQSDAEDEVSIAASGHGRRDYALLLDAMSYLGSGPVALARRLIATADSDAAYVGTEACHLFEALGHVELERDSVTLKATAWHVTPPRVVETAAKGNWALTGYRSEGLLELIRGAAREAQVGVVEQVVRGVPVVLLQTRSAVGLHALTGRLEAVSGGSIRVREGMASRDILDALPTTRELSARLPRALMPRHDSPRFNPRTTRWDEDAGAPTLAQVSALPSLHTVLTRYGARHVDSRLGKYIAAAELGVTYLRYSLVRRGLTVPTACRLPSLYERVAVLASGLPPEDDGEWTHYPVMPLGLARALAAKFGMMLEEVDR